ncbi:F-box/WD repeat-containing protein [Endozoicomonas sp. ALC020]|uniref:F-box/WD repeat-containing protein n=1 Tax=unclassified Endozoicomonas TaxID=2644528 RepID=UPI003BB13BD2
MHGINNDSVNEPPLPQVEALSLTPTGNHAGRSITVTDEEKKPSLQHLASETLSLIFRHLKLRDIRSLQKVCTRFRDLIKEDNALAKAWFRQFSSAHQNQLRMSINRKDKNQLRAWFESFPNDQVLLESLTDRQTTSVYSASLLFFNRVEMMCQCKTFELVTQSTIDKTYKPNSATSEIERLHMAHLSRVDSAALSADGRYLLTANRDCSAKIYGCKADGTWEIKTIIHHYGDTRSAIFSPDSRHVVITSDAKAMIYDLGCNESWEQNTTILHGHKIKSATFSTDSRHVATVSFDYTAQIHSLKDHGSWELTTKLPRQNAVLSATFSVDGCLITACQDKTVKIHSQKADGSWEQKDIISHDSVVELATFSADGCYVIIASTDCKAKIYGKKCDGSWVENTVIQHGGHLSSATFSPDGRHVVTASNDRTVKIYGRKANDFWEEKATFSYSGFVLSATFSPDGCHVMTTIFSTKTAKIIGQQDDGTWSEKANIVHDDWVTSATFSADGSQVITSGFDGIVKITELRKNHLLPAVTG